MLFTGESELDESYFGDTPKGKPGRGATGKISVFGLLGHDGHIYTSIIINAKTDTRIPIIHQKIKPDSI